MTFKQNIDKYLLVFVVYKSIYANKAFIHKYKNIVLTWLSVLFLSRLIPLMHLILTG
jgi:hypothetical protein